MKQKSPEPSEPSAVAFRPRMLQFAREAKGLTQKDLSELTGIAQGTISKAENGQLVPPPEAIAAFAKGLTIPPAFFEEELNFHPSVVFYRKQAALKATDAKRIRAMVAIAQMRISKLANAVEIPSEIPSLDRDVIGRRSAADLARELRILWRVPEGPIPNVTELVEEKGAIVAKLSFNSDRISGLSLREAGDPPTMFVNRSLSTDRLRFTVAHELGHLILHHGQLSLPDDGETEREADEFAGEFLAPRDQIADEFPSRVTIESLSQMKVRWGISLAALVMRAFAVGRISESTKGRLFRDLSMRGYRKREPLELPSESPESLTELIRVHREDLGLTDAQLLQSLKATREALDELLGREQTVPGLRLVRN